MSKLFPSLSLLAVAAALAYAFATAPPAAAGAFSVPAAATGAFERWVCIHDPVAGTFCADNGIDSGQRPRRK